MFVGVDSFKGRVSSIEGRGSLILFGEGEGFEDDALISMDG